MHKTVSIDEAKLNLDQMIQEIERDQTLIYIITVDSIPKAMLSAINGDVQLVTGDAILTTTVESISNEVDN
ncbi:hypothetical protein KC660_03425 [Candidatus Dojkabacteria bacterium]|uniref:Uncharacterized protein n=1 Tax=Candidatus Dojkabacteria bacterium TaxID=2099670 RepID=A0A955L406_9BACT|nr:hypothetical protein [Candidatus Dojkabacteria bacterium]